MNSGLRSGLFQREHLDKMGAALGLFCWLVTSQTRRNGLVFGGKPLTYEEISRRMGGVLERNLRRWMHHLIEQKYIQVKHCSYKRMIITILNQKKFNKQQEMDFSKRPDMADKTPINSAKNGRSERPNMAVPAVKSGRINKSSNESLSSAEKPDMGAPLGVGCQDLSIPLALWLEYKQLRERLHRPIIPGAETYVFAELQELRARGLQPAEVLRDAIRTSSWKLGPSPNRNHKGGASAREERNREAARQALSRYGD